MKKVLNLSLMITLLTVGCKASEDFSGSESVQVKSLRKTYGDNVNFILVNISTEPVQVESTQQFYIEKNIDNNWQRVPFIPCPCGTPCRPSVTEKLDSGSSLEISWSAISRKCNRAPTKSEIENLEEKVSSGEYRMIFNVNRERKGMRIDPEKLVVNFSIN